MKNLVLPSGKPELMYQNSEVYGVLGMGLPFDEDMYN